MRKRVTGLPDGAVDIEKQEIRFTLSLGADGKMDCVAKVGIVEQVISGLAKACRMFRDHSVAQGGVLRSTAAETVSVSLVQRERLHDVVLLQLITDRDIPYTFALPLADAVDISARLKTEAERDVSAGSA